MPRWMQVNAVKKCFRESLWSPGHKAALDKSLTWFHSWSRPPKPAFASQAAAAPENFFLKVFWNIAICHLRIFFLNKVFERLRLATWGQERVEKLHCSLQEAWRGYLGEKVKLTMSRSFLFLRSFGCNLHICQQHWLKDPKNRGYAEKKDGKEGRTDHSEAAMSNWSTDLKLCNSIE